MQTNSIKTRDFLFYDLPVCNKKAEILPLATAFMDSSVRRIFKRGDHEIQKISELWRTEWKFSAQNQVFFPAQN